ncbi:hypothetical protein HaLaN_24775, partial [Haematococcus lacustris]
MTSYQGRPGCSSGARRWTRSACSARLRLTLSSST